MQLKSSILIVHTNYGLQTWKYALHCIFLIRNGVHQGAVISPIPFNFYNLFELLKVSGRGCVINNFYAGCFGYADDLFFLCPSRKGLQEMLDIAFPSAQV